MNYVLKLTKDVPFHLRRDKAAGYERWGCYIHFETDDIRAALDHFATLDFRGWEHRSYRGKCDTGECAGYEKITQERIDSNIEDAYTK